MDVTPRSRQRHIIGMRRRVPTAAVLLCAAGVLIAGCGGSTSPAGSAPAGTPAGSAAARSGEATGSVASPAAESDKTVKSTDPVTRGHKPVRARQIPGINDEEGASGAKPLDPCTLVTRSEAGAIVGKQISKVSSAPQGPTCIYQPRGAAQSITLAVESTSLRALRQQSRELSRTTLNGRPVYCVKLGATMTFVPLSSGRVLNVTAPCPMAASFAAKALARLGR